MNTGLNPPRETRIELTIASATSLLAWVQASITLLYRSPKVIWPVLYARWNRFTRASASASSSAFSAGISRSSMPIETPPMVAKPEPELLEPVEERDRLRQARPAVALAAPARDSSFFFISSSRKPSSATTPPGQDAVEQHPAHRGPEPPRTSRVLVAVSRGGTYQKWIARVVRRRSPLSSAISSSASVPKYLAPFQSRASASSLLAAPARRSSSSNPAGSLVRK